MSKGIVALEIGLVSLAVGGLVYGAYILLKSKGETSTTTSTSTQPASSGGLGGLISKLTGGGSSAQSSAPKPAAGLNYDLILSNGSRGNEVKMLQGWIGATPDGIFGAQTQAALAKATGGLTSISLNAYEGLIGQPAPSASSPL